MNRFNETLRKALEYVLPWLVLAVLLTYSYADFFRHPYGFRWSGSDGMISKVFVTEREPTIHVGDKLVRVGSTDLQSFQRDLRKELFEGVKPGDIVPVTVKRGDQFITVQWMLPGTNAGEVGDQLFGEWFLAYFFWLAGTLTLLVIRPRDDRWFLLAAFDFLTSIWLIAGSGLSFFHIWYSALVLRAAVWISLPLCLHLHWVFPRPLGKLPSAVVWIGYAAAAGFAVAQWLQLIPSRLYILAFLVALVGSLILLMIHRARQPDMRRDLAFLLIAAVLAVVPSIVLGVVLGMQGSLPPLARLSLLSLPMLPLAYLYAAYRRQAGGLEVRVNRLISIYTFLILLGAVMVPLLAMSARLPTYSPDQTLIIGVVAIVVATALSLWVYPIFQSFVERRLLGIAVPSRQLQQSYSSHITSSTSFSGLTRLLNDEIMPSLLVRQFVFLILENGSTRVLLSSGVTESQLPILGTQALLQPAIGKHDRRALIDDPRFAWIRLVLPLRVEEDVLGFWLFGRRDPDDTYSSVEIPILQSFANQTAVALSNILQTGRLRAMYQADINRHENERLALARELHDSVLNELAGMLMNADMGMLPKNFQDGYKTLTQRLREIVSDLRPPMLNYGLQPAIEELADNLMERSKDTVSIAVNLQSTGARYPLEKEQHLFRIVQEACENAVRHSRGSKITILGQLEQDYVELNIVDDGDGFQLGKGNIELYALLSEGHFGLAGMFERAELINAQIRIASAPGTGTAVSLRWRGNVKPSRTDQGSAEFSN